MSSIILPDDEMSNRRRRMLRIAGSGPIASAPVASEYPVGVYFVDNTVSPIKTYIREENQFIEPPSVAFDPTIDVFSFATDRTLHTNYNFVPQTYATIRYVDAVSGNDVNDGLTIQTAWKTLTFCISQLNALAVVSAEIILLSSKGSNLSSGVVANFDCYIHSNDDALCDITSGRYGSSVDILFNGTTWRGMFSGTTRIYDLKNLDSNGLPMSLVKLASSTDVINTPGTFAAGSSTYVNLIDGRKPDDDVIVLTSTPLTLFSSGNSVHAMGCRFIGGLEATSIIDSHFNDCSFVFGADSSFELDVSGVVYFNKCEFKWARADQVDYRGTAIGYEIDCSVGNGYGILVNANCSTAHDNAIAYRISSVYSGGSGIQRTIHDVAYSQTWNIGCVIGDGLATDIDYGSPNVANGIFDSSGTSKVYLDSCVLTGKKRVFTSSLGVNCTTHIANMGSDITYINPSKALEYQRTVSSVVAHWRDIQGVY